MISRANHFWVSATQMILFNYYRTLRPSTAAGRFMSHNGYYGTLMKTSNLAASLRVVQRMFPACRGYLPTLGFLFLLNGGNRGCSGLRHRVSTAREPELGPVLGRAGRSLAPPSDFVADSAKHILFWGSSLKFQSTGAKKPGARSENLEARNPNPETGGPFLDWGLHKIESGGR